MKDRDPARVDDPFLIEKLTAELPGILLWMLEGLHRLLANRYQFTISERSRRNLEAAMEDGDNLSQFMQASAYVRFKPDTEERSTYLYRAYTKWCEDNLESPVPQKKFSQFLLKKCGEVWPDLFQAHRGKVRVCEAQRNNEVPSGDFKRPNGLAQQDGGAFPRQVLRFPGRMRPPRLCCGIKHTKSEILPPHAPKISGFDLLSLFSQGAYPPFRADTGRQHALRGGRETRMRPKRARASQPCAIQNQHRKVLYSKAQWL